MSVKTWIEEKLLWAKTGVTIKIENDGNPVEPIIIRYKDLYFEIMIDAETGQPTGSFGWTQGNPITQVPIREFYTAVREGE